MGIFRVGVPGISVPGVLTLAEQGACGQGQIVAPAGNGLLNNLIAYWPGNEANGDLLDAHTNALHLTDVNTVTSNPGLVYALARQYTLANSEQHVRPGDDALLSTGDVDFTLTAWAYLDGKGSNSDLQGKWNTAGNQREYGLLYHATTDRWRFIVSSTGVDGTTLTASNLGSPSLSTWYFIVAWHDAANDTINIQVNNGAVDSIAYAIGVFDSTTPFTIGNRVAGGDYMSGRIGPSAMWKSAAGGGGVLDATKRTALFNGGAGLAYAAFTA